MKKQNPQFRWHLTPGEKKKIAAMTKRGIRQSIIARTLRIGAPSVSRAQKQMGLPTRLVIPEKKILALFRRGWGGYRIARHLKIAVSAVYKIAHKNKFRRADGIGYTEPHGDVAGFIEAIKLRQGYIKGLAKKYGVGFCAANRIAHEVLACPEFRPGVSWPPLSSNFPQKHWDPKLAKPDDFVLLVQKVCAMCFAGRLPATDDSVFVNAMLAGLAQTILAGQPQAVLDSFAAGLTQAVSAFRESQNSQWEN